MQLKALSTIKRAVRSPYGGVRSLTGPSAPLTGLSVPRTGLLCVLSKPSLKFVKKILRLSFFRPRFRRAPDTSNFLRHVMRAICSVRPKCSHRCVSLKETPLKPVQSLKHTTKNSAEQTVMRTKWFKHIAI